MSIRQNLSASLKILNKPISSKDLYIEFDQDIIFAGDTITGKILLDLMNDMHCSHLTITIKAIESCNFTLMEDESNENNKVFIKKIEQGLNFYSKETIHFDLPIYIEIENEFLVSGQYVFPFTIKIPNNYPSNFEFYNNQTKSSLKYYFIASLNDKLQCNNLQSHRLFIINQRYDREIYPTELSETKTISNICFNKGICSIKLICPETFLIYGEKTEILCEIDNRLCKVDVESVDLMITQNITLGESSSAIKNISRTIFKTKQQLSIVKIYLIL